MNRVSCGRREGDSFDRASWPAPTALVVRVVRAACSTARHGAPPRTRSEGCWGKGHKGRGVVCQDSWRAGDGETMGATEMGFLSMRGACEYARVWGKKKPKAKFARCSGIGKLCPHATASPKSPRKHAEAADNCAVGAEWGGGGNEQNGQESAPPRPKSVSRFRASF